MEDNFFNIYQEEENTIANARRILASEALAHHEYREALANLLCGYERLLRETKRLIKISDWKEKELNQLNRQLKQLADILEYQATHDALTGLFNKETISKFGMDMLSESDILLMVFDVDFFKKVNDTYGHLVGDYVLKNIAKVGSGVLDRYGVLGRFGGEEFVAMLPMIAMDQGVEIANRVLGEIAKSECKCDKDNIVVTVSIGLTVAQKGEVFEAAYERADAALYRAKVNGRNRVEVAWS